MNRLLVTGASGFLGWNICTVTSKTWKVFGTAFSTPATIPNVNIVNVDLTDFRALKRLFHDVRPDAVIHAAAAANPNFCQTHRTESYKINVDTSFNIAGLCADGNIPCVFVSTDLVFDGLNPPYRETDPVCPVNVYGEQKVSAEEKIRKSFPRTVVCRMPLMFGHSGTTSTSFLQPMLRAMRKGRELHLFTDEFRTPISAKTAVSGLLLALRKTPDILHLGGNERISRYDFGRLVAGVFRIENAKLTPCREKDIVMAAPRPPDVSLDNSKASRLGFSPLPLEKELQELKDFPDICL
ncbi:MAG: NAD(P)-dependent oxidoreductase [Nitrospirae bacterium]|nr:NAD(P)-dependent oxidoreductase [Nitrospirota bacterium]